MRIERDFRVTPSKVAEKLLSRTLKPRLSKKGLSYYQTQMVAMTVDKKKMKRINKKRPKKDRIRPKDFSSFELVIGYSPSGLLYVIHGHELLIDIFASQKSRNVVALVGVPMTPTKTVTVENEEELAKFAKMCSERAAHIYQKRAEKAKAKEDAKLAATRAEMNRAKNQGPEVYRLWLCKQTDKYAPKRKGRSHIGSFGRKRA